MQPEGLLLSLQRPCPEPFHILITFLTAKLTAALQFIFQSLWWYLSIRLCNY